MSEHRKTKTVDAGRDAPLSINGRVPVEELAEHYLDRLRSGEAPDIESYAAQHPEQADEIRELFPTLAMLEEFAPAEPNGEDLNKVLGPQDMPRQLGEYHIRAEIGRGGMGIVYEAEHDTMRRRVALKVLPKEIAAQGKNLERFLREARAAGNLHHTNIVPVFGVGSDNGLHFYSMQYIHGQNLDAVIDELRKYHELNVTDGFLNASTLGCDAKDEAGGLSQSIAHQMLTGHWDARTDAPPHCVIKGTVALAEQSGVALSSDVLPASNRTESSLSRTTRIVVPHSSELSNVGETHEGYFRRVARVGQQVANALKYAHGQGVLHRDIKPSNLILDTEGVVWVTDFGLAKHEGDDFTHTGDIVGTLRYMAPERFRGHADTRSDIYSLGLTLYELCTFRYAYDQSNRAHLIHQVTRETPTLPRKINPLIPRDLETIILKAIDKDANHRYQSAAQMAEDLRLFISDHPIRARRTSLPERTWRWCRRNPIQAALASCVALLLVVLAVGSLIFAYASSRHARQLELENQRAVSAEKDVRKANTIATNALYESHVGRASASRWSKRPGQHFTSLSALNAAAKILPTLGLPASELEKAKLKLRNETIAAMPLVDVRAIKTWQVEDNWTEIVAFSAEYDVYAQSDLSGNISVRRVSDDQQIQQFDGPGVRAWMLRFSADGRYLAGKFHDEGTAPLIWVWEIQSGRVVLECDSRTVVPQTMSFAPDGERLAVLGADRALRIYTLPGAEVIFEESFGTKLTDVSFDPTGERVAIASDAGAYVVDTPKDGGAALKKRDQNPGTIALQPAESTSCIAWSGAYISAGTPAGLIHVWDASCPQKTLLDLEGHLALVAHLNPSNSGKFLFSRSWDGTSRIWDLQRGYELLRVDFLDPARSPFSSDDRYLGFSGPDSSFGIWELALGEPLQSLGDASATSTGWMAQFHPTHSNLIAAATNRGVQLWDMQSGMLLQTLPSGYTQAVLFTPDGNSIFTSGSLGLIQWPLDINPNSLHEISVGSRKQILSGTTGRASMDSTGRYLAADHGNLQADVVDLRDPQKCVKLGPHASIDRAVLSPDGAWVVTATWQGHGVIVWDRESGKLIKNLAPKVGSATPAFSPDGNWLAVGTGQIHMLWNTKTWQCVHRFPREQPDGWPGHVSFSPDSQFVVFAYTRYSAQLMDVESGTRIAILEPPQRKTLGWSTFSRDGRHLAFTEENFLQIWDWETVTKQLGSMNLD